MFMSKIDTITLQITKLLILHLEKELLSKFKRFNLLIIRNNAMNSVRFSLLDELVKDLSCVLKTIILEI